MRQDKVREVRAGHDGTWVAHPGLVPVAKEIFDAHMKTPNQISRRLGGLQITAADLLKVPEGEITEAGLRWNIDVGLQYLAAWLDGNGCVPIYNLMEDAATAEICRAQIWQWAKHGARLNNGGPVTEQMVRDTLNSVLEKFRKQLGDERFQGGKLKTAGGILERLMTDAKFHEFLTLDAYEYLA